MKKLNHQGFTLLELMISSMIFSVILLICATTLVQIGKNYHKGISEARTQGAARQAMEIIAEAIQYGGAKPSRLGPAGSAPNIIIDNSTGAPESSGSICLGSLRLDFIKYQKLKDDGSPGDKALRTSKSCSSATEIDPKELLSKNMRVSYLSLEERPGGDYKIKLKVTLADDDLIYLPTTPPPKSPGLLGGDLYGQCLGEAGSQFCAVSVLETTVHRKLK